MGLMQGQGEGGGIVTIHSQPCRYCLFLAEQTFMTLKCIYMVKRRPYMYSVKKFSPYLMVYMTIILPCKHNIFIVSHEIAGPNR